MELRSVSFFLLLCAVLAVTNFAVCHDPEPDPALGAHTLLRRKILNDYDKNALPTAYNQTLPITVSLQATILSFEVDDMKMSVRFHAWISYSWMDKRLAWDPKDHGDIGTIRMSSAEIWKPDITLYNEQVQDEVQSSLETEERVLGVVQSDGSVSMLPALVLVAFCKAMDFTHWPLDEQTCELKFGSWTYDGNSVDLQLSSNTTSMEELAPKLSWHIEDLGWNRTVTMYSCCPDPYVSVSGFYKFTRVYDKFYPTLFSPIHVVVIMTLVSFWINNAYKVGMAFANAVIVLGLLLHHSCSVPTSSGEPIIFEFMGRLLILQAVHVIWVAFVPVMAACLARLMSNSVRGFRRGYLGAICCLENFGTSPASGDAIRLESEEDNDAIGQDFGGGNLTAFPETLAHSGSKKEARMAAIEDMRDRVFVERILELLMFICFLFVLIGSYISCWPSRPPTP